MLMTIEAVEINDKNYFALCSSRSTDRSHNYVYKFLNCLQVSRSLLQI